MTDLVEMLRKIQNLRPGDMFPEEWGPGEWGTPLSKMCGDAADEIERLRADKEVTINYDVPSCIFWSSLGPRTVEWSIAPDPTDWSPSYDAGSMEVKPEPWGSPYAMNPENWK